MNLHRYLRYYLQVDSAGVVEVEAGFGFEFGLDAAANVKKEAAVSAVNRYGNYASGITDPPRGAVAITPDNDNDLAEMVRGISIGGAGDLRVTFVDGETVTLPSEILAVGVRNEMQVVRVLADETTATVIWGWL